MYNRNRRLVLLTVFVTVWTLVLMVVLMFVMVLLQVFQVELVLVLVLVFPHHSLYLVQHLNMQKIESYIDNNIHYNCKNHLNMYLNCLHPERKICFVVQHRYSQYIQHKRHYWQNYYYRPSLLNQRHLRYNTHSNMPSIILFVQESVYQYLSFPHVQYRNNLNYLNCLS